MSVGTVDVIEIEEDIHVLLKAASHENQHAKRKSAVSQEAVQKVARSVMAIHLVVIEKKNGKSDQKSGAGRKIQVAAGRKNRHAKQNGFPKKSQVNAITMLRNELVQKIHLRENHQMTHQKKTWT